MTAPNPVSTPNPGSIEAWADGCLCPMDANHYGHRPPVAGSWYVREGCPVHAPGGVRVRRLEAAT